MPNYKSSRLKFPKGKQRVFVESVFEKSGLNTNPLAEIVKVSPRTIRDWKREKFNISTRAVNIFIRKYNLAQLPQKNTLLEEWKKMKHEVNKKGGFACFQKYGSPGTLEGRRRGGRKTIKILRMKGLFNPPKQFKLPNNYSCELAEWVGILLGDGSITTGGQVHITLNLIKDAKYQIFVSNLGKRLFGEIPSQVFRPEDGVSVTYYSGVNLVKYLVDIGMKIGNKVRQQVAVPNWILKNHGFRTACLRGLIDTDGCIGTHIYVVNGKQYTYKNLVFANRSIPLINFVHAHLNNLEFGAKIADKLETKYVWLYNYKQTKRYLEVVGTHNQRILTQGG